ncbi:hypothetical protein QYE76_007452 [Lolium multiflorum]|uniref:TF-B3 domain-containing protein n=1 Tax=Lolium multiflorum TaxID=4521 RepID=A0AAD8W368_LOLMU|nr:hypothetical protein QYE76_007452 [Lolium multiflorum]
MYLHIGWEKFARHHSLQAGFVLVFSYFGEDMSVKVFDKDALPPELPPLPLSHCVALSSKLSVVSFQFAPPTASRSQLFDRRSHRSAP